MENNKWVLNLQEDDFWNATETFDTKEEAIKEGRECLKNIADCIDINGYDADLFGTEQLDMGDIVNHFFVGKTRNFEPSIDVDDIFERLEDDAFNEAGEIAEDYLWNIKKEESDELSTELTKVFNEWASKYNHEPHFYIIDDIEKIEV